MLPLLHSNINEYMYKAGKVPSVILVADNTVLSFGFTKLIHVLVLSLNIFWHDLLFVFQL